MNAVNAEGLRDIQGPVSLNPDLWPWVVGGLVLLLFIVYVIFRRKDTNVRAVPAAPARPAWELSLEGLDRLAQGRFLAEGRYKEYYSLLSDIVRSYIEARFEIRAPEMTTEEFLNFSYTSEKLNDRQKMFLGDLLRSSDMVKFAKYIPQMDQARENLSLARKFIEETRPVTVSPEGRKNGI